MPDFDPDIANVRLEAVRIAMKLFLAGAHFNDSKTAMGLAHDIAAFAEGTEK